MYVIVDQDFPEETVRLKVIRIVVQANNVGGGQVWGKLMFAVDCYLIYKGYSRGCRYDFLTINLDFMKKALYLL